MTLFDWLNQILLHKKKWQDFDETEQKTFNTFMINRFLSMSSDFVDAVNICQEHTYQMKDKDVYNLYKDYHHTETEKEPIPSEAVSNAFRKLGIKQ